MEQRIKKQISKNYINLCNFKARSNQDINDKYFKFICDEPCTQQIRDLNITQNKITQKGMVYFPLANWKNLYILSIDKNLIGNKGCKFITKAALPIIQNLNLDENQIGSEGVIHISKGNWKNLKTITLSKNFLGSKNLKYLTRNNWAIQNFLIHENKMLIEEMLLLLLYKPKAITTLWTDKNEINKDQIQLLKKLLALHFGKIEIKV